MLGAIMSFEKRTSLRLPVLGPQQDGELRIGDRRMPVQILDQSANGFAALASNISDLAVGSNGLLRVGEDWFDIRLANISPVELPESEESFLPEVQEQYYRLGLYRITDTLDPDKKQKYCSPVWRINLYSVIPANITTISFGLLFAIFVIGMPICMIIVFRGWETKKGGDSVRLTKHIAATKESDNYSPNWEKVLATEKSRSSTSSSNSEKSQPQQLTPDAGNLKALQTIINKKPGASVFAVPEILTKLELSPAQQKQIQAIIDATDQVLAELKKELKDHISPEQYEKVMKAARESAVQVLTGDQRRRWQILTGEKPTDKRAGDTIDDK